MEKGGGAAVPAWAALLATVILRRPAQAGPRRTHGVLFDVIPALAVRAQRRRAVCFEAGTSA
ncbi:hypothetical protein GCM10017643_36840 [Ancylobacter dichloromethanicus]|uniref:Uncharacterized protein n=1 Tax=Ancylobacter dichloromethanicus TaxID=518825 RepID=A0A9W6JAT0_9HYPH|nr:hypothetical protein GCM10017643_36840 [Ancylobacter dichloromethanicus]